MSDEVQTRPAKLGLAASGMLFGAGFGYAVGRLVKHGFGDGDILFALQTYGNMLIWLRVDEFLRKAIADTGAVYCGASAFISFRRGAR